MSDICQHGSLARKCEICERDEEIKNLRTENDRLKALLKQGRELLYISEFGAIDDFDNADYCFHCGGGGKRSKKHEINCQLEAFLKETESL